MISSQTDVKALLVRAGVLQKGHFVLTSGLHSGDYADKDSISSDTRAMQQLCYWIAEQYKDIDVEVVVGPAYGAIVAAHVVAREYNELTGRDAKPVFALKNADGTFEIRKSMRRHVRGKRALVIEDILTTGGSARNTVGATRAAGASEILGLSAFVNRGKVSKFELGLSDEARMCVLLEMTDMQTYSPEDCPLCSEGVPISTEFGHGGSK